MITNEWNVQNGTGSHCNSCDSNKTLPSPHATPKPGVNCVANHPFANTSTWGHDFRGCGGALLVGHLKLLVGYPGDTRLYGKPAIRAGSGHEGEPDMNRLQPFPCQRHCLFNTTADPSETVDLSERPAYARALQSMLRRYQELSTQGEDVFAYSDMLKQTGEVCVKNVNDSCAIAQTQRVVEPCGYLPNENTL